MVSQAALNGIIGLETPRQKIRINVKRMPAGEVLCYALNRYTKDIFETTLPVGFRPTSPDVIFAIYSGDGSQRFGSIASNGILRIFNDAGVIAPYDGNLLIGFHVIFK